MKRLFLFFILIILLLSLTSCTRINDNDLFKPEAMCTDSDHGIYEYVKGEAASRNALNDYRLSTGSDICIDENTLQETYCNHVYIDSEYIECQNGCKNGICLEMPELETSCVDSDHGKNYYVRGFVKDADKIYMDKCDTFKELAEFFCENGKINVETYLCKNDCKSGICIDPVLTSIAECTDSDNGINQYVKGEALSRNELNDFKLSKNPDTCIDENTLQEAYCIGIYSSIKQVDCQKGCKDDVCLGEPEFEQESLIDCIDSDTGRNYYVKGTVRSGLGKKVIDRCNSAHELIEYFCRNDPSFDAETHRCVHGCKDGACLRLETVTKPDPEPEPEAKEICTDSDVTDKFPDGKNIYMKGVSKTSKLEKVYATFKDSCEMFDTIVEGYCTPEGKIKAYEKVCLYGCKDDACLKEEPDPEPEASCTDSDGGIDKYVWGKVISINSLNDFRPQTNSDVCFDENTLQEAYCDGVHSPSEHITCQNGCEDGVCLRE